MKSKLEVGAATALVGASVFSIHNVYTQHAGSLDEVRNAPANDAATHRRLVDADVLTGALVLLVGGTLASVTGSTRPMWLAAGALTIISAYYHVACSAEGTV